MRTNGKQGLPLFVYGTLRVGEHNFRWASECLSDQPDLAATAPGHLWFSYPNSYPVAQFAAHTPDTIKGDVLWCNADDITYRRMVRMEEGAGYELRPIEVTLEDGSVIDAYGFHYLGLPNASLFIEDGDWQKAYYADLMPEIDDAEDDEYEWLNAEA